MSTLSQSEYLHVAKLNNRKAAVNVLYGSRWLSVSTYNGYFLAISRPGDPDPCVYHMLTGPTTYKGPLTCRGCLSFFSLFYLIIVLLSTRRTTSLVLESIDRFGFCRSPLSHPLVLVLSDIPTSTSPVFDRTEWIPRGHTFRGSASISWAHTSTSDSGERMS